MEEPITVRKVRLSEHYSKLIAADENGTIAVAETDGYTGDHFLRYGIEQAENNKNPPIKLPEAPHCLHVYGTAVYLGFCRSVACRRIPSVFKK